VSRHRPGWSCWTTSTASASASRPAAAPTSITCWCAPRNCA
jgi:hypothetical protein